MELASLPPYIAEQRVTNKLFVAYSTINEIYKQHLDDIMNINLFTY